MQRPDPDDISLSLVPPDHPLIPPRNLEPEASGYLDRLLDIFNQPNRYETRQENRTVLTTAYSDALLVTATLNSLGPLLRTRPSVLNRIVSALVNFDPFKQAQASMNTAAKLQMKSTERTTRMLLINIAKR